MICIFNLDRKEEKMKKHFKLITTITLAIVLVLSATLTAFDEDNFNNIAKPEIELYAENQSVLYTDDGYSIIVDLYEKNHSTRAIKLVGTATFTLKWSNLLNELEAKWVIRLTNNDKIRSVSGEMILKKDILGPINPTLAEMTVAEWYSYGTKFSKAEGTEYAIASEDIDFDDNYIFQWRDFYVEGVEDMYYVTDGERQGEFLSLPSLQMVE